MSTKRYVDSKFWDDSYVSKLDPSEKLLFLYCMTNSLTKLCGVYELSLRKVSFDTGIEKNTVQTIFERFARDGKIFYMPEVEYIFVRNFANYQYTETNPKQKANVDKSFEQMPAKIRKLLDEVCPDWSNISGIIGYDRLSIAHQELELEIEKENRDCGKVDNPKLQDLKQRKKALIIQKSIN